MVVGVLGSNEVEGTLFNAGEEYGDVGDNEDIEGTLGVVCGEENGSDVPSLTGLPAKRKKVLVASRERLAEASTGTTGAGILVTRVRRSEFSSRRRNSGPIGGSNERSVHEDSFPSGSVWETSLSETTSSL